ncbi:MAG: hypothetical protein SOX38_09780, partial [Candidatus Limiplasma sp.]|nr:hypothetical protein [Candidatus Limiplasma sp.]
MKTSPNEGSRNWLPPLFCWLYAAVLLWILGLLTLGQPSLSSYYRYPICVSNAILLPLAAGLIGLWVWRLRARPAMPPAAATSARRAWGRAALYLTLFAAQCLMARCLWFYFGFDPTSVRQGAAALAAGQPLSEEVAAY